MFRFKTQAIKKQYEKITGIAIIGDKMDYRNKSHENQQFYFQRMLITLLFPESDSFKKLYPDKHVENIYRQSLLWHCGVWLTQDYKTIIINPIFLCTYMGFGEDELQRNFFKSDFEPIPDEIKDQVIDSTWYGLYRTELRDFCFNFLWVRNIPNNFQELMKNVLKNTGKVSEDIIDNLYIHTHDIHQRQIKLNMHGWVGLKNNKYNSHTVYTKQYLDVFLPPYNREEKDCVIDRIKNSTSMNPNFHDLLYKYHEPKHF
jgi:hypothetical protein